MNAALRQLLMTGRRELVVNGDFVSGTAGWTVGAGDLSVVSGQGRLTNTGAAASIAHTPITTVPGRTYTLSIDSTPGTTTGNFRIGSTANGTDILVTTPVSGNVPRTFVALASTTWITLRTASAVAGEYADFDNISVR